MYLQVLSVCLSNHSPSVHRSPIFPLPNLSPYSDVLNFKKWFFFVVLSTAGDLSNELVRHFLIECTPKGVRLKGCSNEPYFGELLETLS